MSQHDQNRIFAIDRGRIVFALPRRRARQGAQRSHLCLGKGADTGACGHPATACRTFAFAIAQTAASGTIIAIDPANYGPVTITKSISIVADGAGPAGIFITTGDAIDINSQPTDTVNLRGLTLDGAGTASNGISVGNGTPVKNGTVTITDCFIRHFNGDGISLGGVGQIFLISNTVSADNTGGFGLDLDLSFSNVVVDHFTASGNKSGISISGSKVGVSDVTIVNSVMVNNASDGLRLGSAPNVVRATARLAGSVVTGIGGLAAGGGGIGVNISLGSTAFSYGDNEINGNGTDVNGTLTPIAKK